jgi:hypothetical protein
MKTVDQTKFSLFYADGTRLTYGNCLVACVASILDESIDEVPNVYTFYGLDNKENRNVEDHWWFKILNIWLKEKYNKCIKYNISGTETDQQYVITRGLSQRGKPHCCIFKNEGGTLVPYFDPHPTKQYLSQEHYFYTIEDI